MHLDQARVLKMVRYTYKGKAVIYILRDTVTGMLYIGSTLSPSLRFYHHLIVGGDTSNLNLQQAIGVDGIENFTLYIMEIVKIPSRLSYQEKLDYLHIIEQKYLDKYPREQLYNINRSAAK